MTSALLQRLEMHPIAAADAACRTAAWRRIDSLTKPHGALGMLEALAAQVCAVQQSVKPAPIAPVAMVFAADHGVADRGVSAYPRAVTAQMVHNFLGGGAAISVLAHLHDMPLWIVDAGIDGDVAAHPRLIQAKIRRGTRDFVSGPAMTPDECHAALRRGRSVVDDVVTPPGNTLLLGEMGIGNTASAALLMHGITGVALIDCVGRGTGLDDAGVDKKYATLAAALARAPILDEPVDWLREFGGHEIAMLVGAMLGAAARRLLIVVDGFTVTVAAALAAQIDANVLGYCVFAHCSAEKAHRALLAHLNRQPLLDLGMRLGEGSGAALALPVIQSSVALYNRMATFAGAGVSERLA